MAAHNNAALGLDDNLLAKYGFNAVIGTDGGRQNVAVLPVQTVTSAPTQTPAWHAQDLKLGKVWEICCYRNNGNHLTSKASILFRYPKGRPGNERQQCNVTGQGLPNKTQQLGGLREADDVDRDRILNFIIEEAKKAVHSGEISLADLTNFGGKTATGWDERIKIAKRAIQRWAFPEADLTTFSFKPSLKKLDQDETGKHLRCNFTLEGHKFDFAISAWLLNPVAANTLPLIVDPLAGEKRLIADLGNINLQNWAAEDLKSTAAQKTFALDVCGRAAQHLVNNRSGMVPNRMQSTVNAFLGSALQGKSHGLPLRSKVISTGDVHFFLMCDPTTGLRPEDCLPYKLGNAATTTNVPGQQKIQIASFPATLFAKDEDNGPDFARVMRGRLIDYLHHNGLFATVKYTLALRLHLMRNGYDPMLLDEFSEDGIDGCDNQTAMTNKHQCSICKLFRFCIHLVYLKGLYFCYEGCRNSLKGKMPKSGQVLDNSASNFDWFIRGSLMRNYYNAASIIKPEDTLQEYSKICLNRTTPDGKFLIDRLTNVPIDPTSANSLLRARFSHDGKLTLSHNGSSVSASRAGQAGFYLAGVAQSAGNKGTVGRLITILAILLKQLKTQSSKRQLLLESRDIIDSKEVEDLAGIPALVQRALEEMTAEADAIDALEQKLPHLRKNRAATPLRVVEKFIQASATFEAKWAPATRRCLSSFNNGYVAPSATPSIASSLNRERMPRNWILSVAGLLKAREVHWSWSTKDNSVPTVDNLPELTYGQALREGSIRQTRNALMCDKKQGVDKYATPMAIMSVVLGANGRDHITELPVTLANRSIRSASMAHAYDHSKPAATAWTALEPKSYKDDYDEERLNMRLETWSSNSMRASANAEEFAEFVQVIWDQAVKDDWEILSTTALFGPAKRLFPKSSKASTVKILPEDVWSSECLSR